MTSNLKFVCLSAAAGALISLGIDIYNKISNSCKEANIRRAAEMAKAEEDHKRVLEGFKTSYEKFINKYDYTKLTKVTINNDLLEDTKDRAYLFEKLYATWSKLYHTNAKTIHDQDDLEEFVSKTRDFGHIFDIVSSKDVKTLESYIIKCRSDDEIVRKAREDYNEKVKAEQETQNKLKIIEAKKQSELDILKAKLDLEDSKFKTVMKVMSNGGDKNSSINLKANLDLSGDGNK